MPQQKFHTLIYFSINFDNIRIHEKTHFDTLAKAYGLTNATCPFRKSYPGVLVMQPGQDRNGDNGARSLGCSMKRRIFL